METRGEVAEEQPGDTTGYRLATSAAVESAAAPPEPPAGDQA